MVEPTQSKQIGDHVFSITKLPAMRALKLAGRLGKLFGPAIAKAVGKSIDPTSLARAKASGPVSLADVKIDLGKISEGFGELFVNLSDEEIERVTWELLAIATVQYSDGRVAPLSKPVFDQIFTGDIGGLLRLLGFAFEVQFGPFSGGLLDLARRAGQATSTSNGSSGISPQTSPHVGPPGASG